jgi:DnaJ family protein B protein 4
MWNICTFSRLRLVLICLYLIHLCQRSYCSDFSKQHFASSVPGNNKKQSTSASSSDGNGSSDYYTILGVPRTANDKEIKTAYRKKAMEKHPDKGGKEEEFKQLSEAYEVLSDSKKRSLYDRYGKAGVKSGGLGGGMEGGFPFSSASGDPFHSFRSFHSAFGSSSSSHSGSFSDFFRSFNIPSIYHLEVELEDCFKGRTFLLQVGSVKYNINIEPGMGEGTEIRLPDLRDTSESDEPAMKQIILVLKEKLHSRFKRKGNDLLTELTISLKEMLLGFERVLSHIDGSQFIVKSKEGEINGFDEVVVIEGMGMPIYSSKKKKEKEKDHNKKESNEKSGEKGKLFIKIKVSIPRSLSFSTEERQQLQKMFLTKESSSKISPAMRKVLPSFVANKSDLQSFSFDRKNENKRNFFEESNSEDDGNSGGGTEFGSFFFR